MNFSVSVDKTFSTEFQLLEAYERRRKLKKGEVFPVRARATPGHGLVLQCATKNTSEFVDVADKLTHIVDSVPLAQRDIVEDGDGSDDLIQRLVDLLKKTGDELNEKIQKDHELLEYLHNFSYTMFKKVASVFTGTEMPAKQGNDVSAQKTQIAWTFEMTSRLRALDLQPMNRVMGFGAQYLHEQFNPWVQQNGGWEKVFNTD